MKTLTRTRKKLLTAEAFFDYVHRSENLGRRLELVRGEVIELSRPTVPHGVVCGNASRLVGNYAFQRRKGYVVTNDTGVILERDPDTVRGPDVGYFEGARTFAELPEKWAEVAPRLAIEVLSTNDRADQVNNKLTCFLENGVELVWVIDPVFRTVTVYSQDDGPRVFHEDDVLTGGDVLPGFECRVADFFVMPEEETSGEPKPRKRKKK